MKRTVTLILTVLFFLSMTGVGLAYASTDSTTTPISGVWAGNMSFTGANFAQRIIVTIPAGCIAGSECGDIYNLSVQCDWQMMYDGMNNGAYLYHFSRTLSGGCPAVGSGSFTLLPDGNLYRVHYSTAFTAYGVLKGYPGQN